jgi:hypothetical protein
LLAVVVAGVRVVVVAVAAVGIVVQVHGCDLLLLASMVRIVRVGHVAPRAVVAMSSLYTHQTRRQASCGDG